MKTLAVDELVNYFNAKNDFRREHVAMSIGITDNDSAKFKEVYKQVEKGNLKYVCIDVANGYSERFSNFVRKFRKQYPNVVIIAGNVVTGEMTEELILNGADIVKVGIGPGSVCTTRTMTGVGVPQFSAIVECSDAANGVGGHIMADGGCVHSGDIAKALGGGAHMVMIGGMLAGHDESEQQVVNNKIEFYGMSSDRAREIHGKRKDGYRANEGKLISLPYRGPVVDIESIGNAENPSRFEITDTKTNKVYTVNANALAGGDYHQVIQASDNTIPEEDIKRYYDIAMKMDWQDGWYSTPEMKKEAKTPGYKHIHLGGSDTEKIDYEIEQDWVKEIWQQVNPGIKLLRHYLNGHGKNQSEWHSY